MMGTREQLVPKHSTILCQIILQHIQDIPIKVVNHVLKSVTGLK